MADEYEIACIDEAFFKRDADKRRCWGPIGKTILVKVNGSTQNTSVYGAYTLNGKFHHKFAKKQTAKKTIAFLERLRKIYRKIIFILDRARWHTAKIIQKYAESTEGSVKLVFFPRTSPDLNPVEECWRQTRNNVTANTAFSSTDLLKKRLCKQWTSRRFKHKIINYLCP